MPVAVIASSTSELGRQYSKTAEKHGKVTVTLD
jgi:hypothetical protein